MKKTTTSAICLACLFMLGCVSLALAHQQKAGLTRIVFNDRAGSLEVMHRFNLHDAEHAVGKLFGEGADIHHSRDTQRQFARHVIEAFSLTVDGQAIGLKVVGAEVAGKHVWVYQEAALPSAAQSLTVNQRALHAVWLEQENLVNVEGRGPVKSLRFRPGDGAKSVALAEASLRSPQEQ